MPSAAASRSGPIQWLGVERERLVRPAAPARGSGSWCRTTSSSPAAARVGGAAGEREVVRARPLAAGRLAGDHAERPGGVEDVVVEAEVAGGDRRRLPAAAGALPARRGAAARGRLPAPRRWCGRPSRPPARTSARGRGPCGKPENGSTCHRSSCSCCPCGPCREAAVVGARPRMGRRRAESTGLRARTRSRTTAFPDSMAQWRCRRLAHPYRCASAPDFEPDSLTRW